MGEASVIAFEIQEVCDLLKKKREQRLCLSRGKREPENYLKERDSHCSYDEQARPWEGFTVARRLNWSPGCEEYRYDLPNKCALNQLNGADRTNLYR
jgi:hypothetical protein